jgi:hypothetical protein
MSEANQDARIAELERQHDRLLEQFWTAERKRVSAEALLTECDQALGKVRRELYAWAGDDERSEHAIAEADAVLAKLVAR